MPRGKRKLQEMKQPEEQSRPLKKRIQIMNFSERRCLSWFRELASIEDLEVIGPEGMEKFCNQIGVVPEDVVMLVIAYKLQAKQMGYFTKDEWFNGLKELECDGVAKLKNKLDELRNILNDRHQFKLIYRYAYDFAREKDQRSMDVEIAREMLKVLLGGDWPLYPDFNRFLQESKYKVVNKDQWYNILEFSRTINPDLSNYDVDGAWPVLLDEFVEWLKPPKETSSINDIQPNS